MDALRHRPRLRVRPVVEWMLAALLLAGVVWLGSRALETFRARPGALAAAPVPLLDRSAPPAVPERSVSVPELPFKNGQALRVGDTLRSVAQRLGRSAELGLQSIDRGPLGERLTRFYEYEGARFILVFEPVETTGAARIAAIYLQ